MDLTQQLLVLLFVPYTHSNSGKFHVAYYQQHEKNFVVGLLLYLLYCVFLIGLLFYLLH